MIYQISGCSEALKKWLQRFLVENDFEYYLNKMANGWCFDFDQTKESVSKEVFLDALTRSGLSDADKRFKIELF